MSGKIKMPKTPELDKMKAVQERSTELGQFIDWLHSEGYVIAQRDMNDELEDVEIYDSGVEKLFAKYFKIDLDKCDSERQAILEAIEEADKYYKEDKA